MSKYLVLNIGFLVFFFPWKAQADCESARDRAVIAGPILENTIQQRLQCFVEIELPKKKTKFLSVCVFTGHPKEERVEEMGNSPITAIFGDTPEAEAAFSEIVGIWYSHRKVIKTANAEAIASISVSVNDVMTKISNNQPKLSSESRAKLDKIQVSNVEKKLIFERLLRKAGAGQWQKEKAYSLECKKPKASGDEEKKGETGGPTPPGGTARDARADRVNVPYVKPNSGISSSPD